MEGHITSKCWRVSTELTGTLTSSDGKPMPLRVLVAADDFGRAVQVARETFGLQEGDITAVEQLSFALAVDPTLIPTRQ